MNNITYIGILSIFRILTKYQCVFISYFSRSGNFKLTYNSSYFIKLLLIIPFFFILSLEKTFAQELLISETIAYNTNSPVGDKDDKKDKDGKKKDSEESPTYTYDEIPAQLMIEGNSYSDLDIIFTNNGLLFINVENLFHTILIPCVMNIETDNLEGTFLREDNHYSINYNKKQIRIGDNIYPGEGKMIKDMGMIYIESSLLAETFGINLVFNYRSLVVILKSDFELPITKQKRLEKLRRNLSKLKGEFAADTVVSRKYHLFKPGTIDWFISSTQASNSLTRGNVRIGLGSELLYGEATMAIDYSSKFGFDKRRFHYLWRWVDNNQKIIKQAQIGKVTTQSIAFVSTPIIGAVVRNSPTTIRKAKGYYTISDYTEPNWTVELFINNILIDYTKADASGMYFFKVPNVYGFTTIKLKFYGPMGEERTEERTVNIPYTFMPEKEFEYCITAGVLQDSISSKYSIAEVNYGVNRMLTVGGGVEYLSSITDRPYIPFLKTSIQPYSKLTLIGQYAHGVSAKGIVNFYFLKSASIILDYTKYVKDQKATQFRYEQERRILVSIPYRYKKISGFSKLDLAQYVYKTFIYNQTSILLSAYYKQFSVNTTTQFNWAKENPAYILTTTSLSWRLRRGYIVRPSTRYDHTKGSLISYKLELEKKSGKAYFIVSYERNLSLSDNLFTAGFKYDLSFARTNVTSMQSKNISTITESAQGSITFGSGNKKVITNKNSSVSKGGISFYPFLDINNNGIFDEGEKMVKIDAIRVFGGKPIFNDKDSIIRVPNLNAFISYNIEFNDNDLDNIAWRFKHNFYSVLVDPNQYKHVDIPIVAVGEVLGMAYINENNSLKGLGRITIEFYKKGNNKIFAKTLSESDGYINYLGFPPGDYIAKVDSLQLNKLNFIAEPAQVNFTIKPIEDGDIVENIIFILSQKDIIKKKSVNNSINTKDR